MEPHIYAVYVTNLLSYILEWYPLQYMQNILLQHNGTTSLCYIYKTFCFQHNGTTSLCYICKISCFLLPTQWNHISMLYLYAIYVKHLASNTMEPHLYAIYVKHLAFLLPKQWNHISMLYMWNILLPNKRNDTKLICPHCRLIYIRITWPARTFAHAFASSNMD